MSRRRRPTALREHPTGRRRGFTSHRRGFTSRGGISLQGFSQLTLLKSWTLPPAKDALITGGGKQGGAHRYGQVAALEITGSENATVPSSSSNGSAGMQEMKMELPAITSALVAIGVQKKGGKGKPPEGAPPKGPRKQLPGSRAGRAGAGRSTADALGRQHARDWIKCYNCRQ
jgi:hypothetical protein